VHSRHPLSGRSHLQWRDSDGTMLSVCRAVRSHHSPLGTNKWSVLQRHDLTCCDHVTMHCQWRKAMRPIVNVPKEDRATAIGNMYKTFGKDCAWGSRDILSERQTDALFTASTFHSIAASAQSVFGPGDLDLHIQSRLSDGPNTSSMWIWRKPFSRFPRYLIHKQKNKRSHRQR